MSSLEAVTGVVGVMEYAIAAGAAALIGLLLGTMVGAWGAGRKFRRHYEEVRAEVTRLRQVAEDKLADDDPDLNTLLGKLNDAVSQTYKAAESLENQGKIIRRKSEGGREVIASSRYIARMIDEFSGEDSDVLELDDVSRKPAEADSSEAKPSPPLR